MVSGPLFYIISDEGFLAKQIAFKVEEKLCRGVIVHGVEDLKERGDYVFFIAGFSSEEVFSREKVIFFLNYIKEISAKCEVVVPYIPHNKFEYVSFITKEARERGLQVVYVGELYGEEVGDSLRSFWREGRLVIPEYDFDGYFLTVKQAADYLIRGIFSYGFGKEEIVVAAKMRAFDFVKMAREIVDDGRIYKAHMVQGTMPCFDFEEVKFDKEELGKTLEWLKSRGQVPVKTEKITETKRKTRKIKLKVHWPKLKKGRRFFKRLMVLGIIGFWILAMPFLILLGAFFLMNVGFERLDKLDVVKSGAYFEASRTLATIADESFFVFDEGRSVAQLVRDVSSSGKGIGEVLVSGKEIKEKVLGSEKYDVKNLTDRLYLQMDVLSRQISLLSGNQEMSKFLPDSDLGELSFYLTEGKKIVKEIPNIMGSGKKRKYLVVMQDSRELRPTGGKIESVGIFTFEEGRLSDKTFHSSDSLDRQLRGVSVPPLALEKYLGLRNWNLTNSNWDADFKIAAGRMSWFFEKETGEMVDGVVGVDRDVFNDLTNFKGDFWEWGKVVLQNLQIKNIQVFVDNDKVGDELRKLNWDGGIPSDECGENCQINYVGVVEANVGNNKVNPEVERSERWDMKVTGNKIENRLEINYNNLSEKDSYKNYIRILSGKGGKFSGEGSETFVEILPGEKEKVVFSWTVEKTVDVSKKGKMVVVMRKQPGIRSTMASISLDLTSSLTGNVVRRYNTGLNQDFRGEIDW